MSAEFGVNDHGNNYIGWWLYGATCSGYIIYMELGGPHAVLPPQAPAHCRNDF